MHTLQVLLRVFLAVTAAILALPVAWYFGYISRVVAVATAPDGRVEAVCRGRLPEPTEYDLWFRKAGGVFGRRLGFVGTESMGRCRAVAWSPGGEVVAVLTEGGTLGVFDGRTGKALGFQPMVPRLEDGSYPSRRIVARLTFESKNSVTIEHCDRLSYTTRRFEDGRVCGADVIRERVALNLTSPRGYFGR